ncbi:MAG TPA: gluconokinase, GntK/IdnK-type [Actinocrinis sp.]|jgi:gluconokinase
MNRHETDGAPTDPAGASAEAAGATTPGPAALPAVVVIVSGVSGSGKSTVGGALARELGLPFLDGDALHPPANVAKMAAGHPLDDADRRPWLAALAAHTAAMARARGGVVACSALKRTYRDELRDASPNVCFVQLVLGRADAIDRVAHRPAHFMPAILIDSQFAGLEPLQPDEPGLIVDAMRPLRDKLDRVRAFVDGFRPAG